MTVEGQPKKSKPIWVWLLLGCCAMVLLGLGACVVMGVVGYQVARQYVITDPARVVALADQILPGAAPPQGFAGFMGVDVAGFRMAALAPAGKVDREALSILVMELPVEEKDFNLDEAMKELREQGGVGSGSEQVLSAEGSTVTLGEREVPALRQVVETSTGKRVVRDVAVLGSPSGRPVVVMFTAPEDHPVQEAFAEFGRGVRLEGFQVLELPGAGGPAEEEPPSAEEEPPSGSESP